MISVDAEPATLVAGVSTRVVIRLRNTGPGICFSIVVEIETEFGLIFEDGDPIIEVDQLRPGSTYERMVRLRARTPGRQTINLPNFSYRDPSGTARRRDEPPLVITAIEGPSSPPSPFNQLPPEDHIALPVEESVPTVFISHRRAESTWFVDLLADRLIASLPRSRIFLDKQGIDAGENFRKRLDVELSRCTALLALIGPRWESVVLAGGTPRIAHNNDLVRHEIATALNRDILVIPLLFGGASMPERSALPPDLANLADRHAAIVDDRNTTNDIRSLIDRLRMHGFR